MLILIDGYNVIAPVAPPGKNPAPDWLHRERMRLLDRLATQLDPQLAAKTCVVFDAAMRSRRARSENGDSDSTFRHREIEVRFAVNHDEADDLIEELISLNSAPKRLTVVSSDHRLQTAARRSGATAFDSQAWLDSLLDGKLLLAINWPPIDRDDSATASGGSSTDESEKASAVDDVTVQQWMRAFGIAKSTSGGRSAKANRRSVDQGGGGKSAETESSSRSPIQPQRKTENRPPEPNAAEKAEKPPPRSSQASGDPRRIINDDNPFPDGYGEDLL